ncbi:MAG: dual specificity protein phosphatase family protein [Planctomycetes bacterium]|nr:dual specificity protein phosphatase family protein [Planctomycetota bacterium]MBU1518388.1 dual specificity protein phosphatase family protein [Planctomycetota bacterium]MBU2457370.1 dual specificity protein phosphatase family protein [Planctomycetota bacterium]MBU2596077.1 dual specificity protein phosphatase family protein [Planctomycetota bacterium]
MKKKKNPIFGWLWTAVIIIAVVGLVRHFHIKSFQIVKQGVLYTSGQPRGMDYTRLLYKYHIAAFVNLRNPDEHREDNWYNEEVIWMKDNGVKYIELPIEKNTPTDGIPDAESCREFLEIMNEKANLPVLVHDSSGKKRVSYLAAVWMLKSGGFDLNQTIEKVKQIKEQPLTEQETEFLKSLVP